MAYNFPDSPTLNQVFQNYTWDGEKWISTFGGTAAVVGPAAAFLARTSGLDTTHINAYTALINGLVTDGLWAKLDVLYIFATQDSTTALLNLKSATYNGTSHGSLTFLADRYFSGVDASTTIYVDTGFNPSTASSPQFVQTSAHMSVWSLTNATSTAPALGASTSPSHNELFPKYSDNNAYFRVNAAGTGNFTVNATPTGHFIASRTLDLMDGFRNGSLILNHNSSTSVAVVNLNLFVVGFNNNGPAYGSALQLSMFSLGSYLNSTDATNFYNRLRTYMTAVGVP